MMYVLASKVTRALQTAGSSSLQSGTGIAAISGYAVRDIIQITGCSQAPANNFCVVTGIAGGIMSLTDLAGVSPGYLYSGNPACTVTHVGFRTTSLALDNSVFATPNPDFNLRFRIEELTAQTGVRVHFQDTGDDFITDARPGPMFTAFGYINGPGVAKSFSANREDWLSARLGNPNNAMRATVWFEGQYGAAAPAGANITYTSWVESSDVV